MSATAVSGVGSRQVPAAPLLDDPLAVLDHFLGQPDYPTQGAAGRRRKEPQTQKSTFATRASMFGFNSS